MEKFSNQPKNKRHEVVKVTLIVILKRYFFVPYLLCILNMVGGIIVPIIFKNKINNNGMLIILNIIIGLVILWVLFLLGVLVIGTSDTLMLYLRKRMLIKDFQGFLYDMRELLCICFIDGIIAFFELPKEIYIQIRKEPKLFREAIKKATN